MTPVHTDTRPALVSGRPLGDAAVAVCVPVYQGAATLAATLRSVLAQTWRDLELVVLDNASTDGTDAVLAGIDDPRLTVWRNPVTVPMAENFRRVLELSHAPLLKLLPADDLLAPSCLERQVMPMLADPRLAVVAGRVDLVDERGAVLVRSRTVRGLAGPRGRDEVVRRVVRDGGNPVGADVALAFRRDAYRAAGGYPTTAGIHGDVDLTLRMLEHGRFLGLPETVARFRIAPTTATGAAGDAEFAAQRAWAAALAATDPAVRRRDAALGCVGARFARARRELLFGLVRRRAARRAARP